MGENEIIDVIQNGSLREFIGNFEILAAGHDGTRRVK
jgi:hypothetical protein